MGHGTDLPIVIEDKAGIFREVVTMLKGRFEYPNRIANSVIKNRFKSGAIISISLNNIEFLLFFFKFLNDSIH